MFFKALLCIMEHVSPIAALKPVQFIIISCVYILGTWNLCLCFQLIIASVFSVAFDDVV